MRKGAEEAKYFGKRETVNQVEEGSVLSPRFDEDGLMPCITTEHGSGLVLMLGYVNAEALTKTIETGEAHYWSRSRECLWRKGETSGLVQRVVEMRIDDDQDALWLQVRVEGSGGSCHVGYKSCFYRAINTGKVEKQPVQLSFVEHEKNFDPEKIYGDAPNPTIL